MPAGTGLIQIPRGSSGPTPGMKLWLDAAKGYTTNSDGTPDHWADQSANGYYGAASNSANVNKPTAGTGINGHVTRDFGGSISGGFTLLYDALDQFYWYTGGGPNILTSSGACAMYAVQKYTGSVPCAPFASGRGLGLLSCSDYFGLYVGAKPTDATALRAEFLAFNSGHTDNFNTDTPPIATAYQIEATYDGSSTYTISVGAATPDSYSPYTVSDQMGVLATAFTGLYAPDGGYLGSIGEIIIYDFLPTSGQRAHNKAYFGGRWGVA